MHPRAHDHLHAMCISQYAVETAGGWMDRAIHPRNSGLVLELAAALGRVRRYAGTDGSEV